MQFTYLDKILRDMAPLFKFLLGYYPLDDQEVKLVGCGELFCFESWMQFTYLQFTHLDEILMDMAMVFKLLLWN